MVVHGELLFFCRDSTYSLREVCGIIVDGGTIRIISLNMEENGTEGLNGLGLCEVSVLPVDSAQPYILVWTRKRGTW